MFDRIAQNIARKRYPPIMPCTSRVPELVAEFKRELSDIRKRWEGNKVIYECAGGEATGVPLWKEPAVAVQIVTVPKGCTFDEHVHPEPVTEWVHVIEGKFVVEIKGTGFVRTLSVGDGCYFKPWDKHTWIAMEDSRVLGVTIPADMEGYPDVRPKRSSD